MRKLGLIGTAVILAGSAACFAADLRAPLDLESTAVLPRGVRNPRYKNLFMFVDEKFGGTGGVEPLAYKLNKSVTFQDMVNAQSDPTLKALTQGKIQSLGYSLSAAAGSTTGVVNTYADVKVPVLAYGVTEKFTLAVAVPILSVDVNADTGFAKTEQGEALLNSIGETDPEKRNEAAAKLNDAINRKLTDLGYEKIQSKAVNNIGDIKVVGKYLVMSDANQAVTAKADITLPTGTPPDANKALDIPTGDGQTDLGATVIYDRYLDSRRGWRVNAYAGYTAQLPDTIERRVPVSETEMLSTDKEDLARDLGDVMSAGGAILYEFPFGLNFAMGTAVQHLNATSFGGNKFNPARYRLLETNTRQTLWSGTGGVGFSSVEMFKAKKFVLPLQLNFAYSRPLAGINVVKNDLMALEVVLFF